MIDLKIQDIKCMYQSLRSPSRARILNLMMEDGSENNTIPDWYEFKCETLVLPPKLKSLAITLRSNGRNLTANSALSGNREMEKDELLTKVFDTNGDYRHLRNKNESYLLKDGAASYILFSHNYPKIEIGFGRVGTYQRDISTLELFQEEMDAFLGILANTVNGFYTDSDRIEYALNLEPVMATKADELRPIKELSRGFFLYFQKECLAARNRNSLEGDPQKGYGDGAKDAMLLIDDRKIPDKLAVALEGIARRPHYNKDTYDSNHEDGFNSAIMMIKSCLK